MTDRIGGRSRKLYVYECVGPGIPETEPESKEYLGIWPEPPYYYFFFKREAVPEMEKWLASNEGRWFLKDLYELDYDQWQQIAPNDYRIGPFMIGLSGVPSKKGGQISGESSESIPIRLNPSVVFGSGVHQSTQGCLMALAYLFRQSEIKTAIDLGTGSGILALACARLGASKVYALDCNMLAAGVTLQNVRLNGLESKIEVLLADSLKVFKNSADLLVMNLEWPSLCCIIDEEDLSGFRWIVMSGFLHRQFKKLNSRIPPLGSIVFFENRDGWTTLLIKSDKSPI